MIELNTRYTLTPPTGTISTEGIRQIDLFIARTDRRGESWMKLNPGYTGSAYLPTLPNNWEWVWLTRAGKMTTRVRKFFYHRHSSSPDNLRSHCATCQKRADAERWQQQGEQLKANQRQRYAENADRERQRVRDYHARHPERHKRAAVEWNQANPDRRRINQHRYRNSEKGLEYERRYDAENRAMRNLKESRRRARKRNLPDAFTHQDYERMMAYWDGCCAITGTADNLQLDHWIPLASPECPGTIPANIIPLAASLNASKQDKDPAQWLADTFGVDRADEIPSKVNAYFGYLRDNCPH